MTWLWGVGGECVNISGRPLMATKHAAYKEPSLQGDAHGDKHPSQDRNLIRRGSRGVGGGLQEEARVLVPQGSQAPDS